MAGITGYFLDERPITLAVLFLGGLPATVAALVPLIVVRLLFGKRAVLELTGLEGFGKEKVDPKDLANLVP